MKQTAVVFEAKIGSAGSAIDPNSASRADNIQRGGRKTGEMKRGKKRQRGDNKGGEELKGGGARELCFSQAEGMSKICVSAKVNFACAAL